MIIFDNSICKVNRFFPSRHETPDSKIGNNWQAETLEKDAELKNHGGSKKRKKKKQDDHFDQTKIQILNVSI